MILAVCLGTSVYHPSFIRAYLAASRICALISQFLAYRSTLVLWWMLPPCLTRLSMWHVAQLDLAPGHIKLLPPQVVLNEAWSVHQHSGCVGAYDSCLLMCRVQLAPEGADAHAQLLIVLLFFRESFDALSGTFFDTASSSSASPLPAVADPALAKWLVGPAADAVRAARAGVPAS